LFVLIFSLSCSSRFYEGREQWSAGRGPHQARFGLDGVEKPSPAMKDFDFEPRANGQERKANGQKRKANRQNDSMLLLLLLILFCFCF